MAVYRIFFVFLTHFKLYFKNNPTHLLFLFITLLAVPIHVAWQITFRVTCIGTTRYATLESWEGLSAHIPHGKLAIPLPLAWQNRTAMPPGLAWQG